MKVLHTKTLKDGRTHVLVELLKGEANTLTAIPPNRFWKLGYPLERQVIESHHLAEMQCVAWDAYSQEWVDV